MQRLPRAFHYLLLALALTALGLTSGCDTFAAGETPAPEATTQAAASPTPDGAAAPPGTPSATVAAPAATRLILWTVPDIAPRVEVPGGATLTQQLTTFDSTNPGFTLEVDFKAESGPASTVNYLRTGRSVAPAILPDLILIPSSQLAAAVEAGLVFPLDDPDAGQSLLSEELLDDLFPAAEQLGRLNLENGPLMGYPFVLRNVTHLAYNSSAITTTLAATWTALGEENNRLIFPADGPEGARLLLQLYLAAGGTLVNEAGQPALEAQPLTRALTTLEQGRRAGTIVLESSNTRSFDDAWVTLAAGTSTIALTDVHRYLSERAQGDGIGVAPVPGFSAALPPLIDGWVLALSSTDPVRQQAAIQLIGWLTDPDNLAVWSQEAGYVPARRSALAAWSGNDDYFAFLDAQLTLAQPYPVTATGPIQDALAIALFDVISLARTPGAAAEEALQRLRP